MIRRGREGSTDKLILLADRAHGIYLSVRVFRWYGFWLAYGPGYKNRAGLRR